MTGTRGVDTFARMNLTPSSDEFVKPSPGASVASNSTMRACTGLTNERGEARVDIAVEDIIS
jgi:hypothetical protein